MTIQFICMDNTGENKPIIKKCKSCAIAVEMTASYTLEYKGIVEWMIQTLKNKATAMLTTEKLEGNLQDQLWAHAMDDTILTHNLLPRIDHPNSHKPFGDLPPITAIHLLEWVNKCTFQPNFVEKAEEVMRVGYAHNAPKDTYLVLKMSSKQLVDLHNIAWYSLTPLEAITQPDRNDVPNEQPQPAPDPFFQLMPTVISSLRIMMMIYHNMNHHHQSTLELKHCHPLP